MLAIAKSDIGRIRQTNEDSYACISPNLYIVADGMGGHAAGEIASSMVVNIIKDMINQQIDNHAHYENLLQQAIFTANISILNEAKKHTEYAGMGTTISFVHIVNEQCFWGHVGDSRIYLLRNNELIQLTKDHSLVWELVEKGTITKAEARIHPQRNMLTRAVGVEENLKVDTGYLTIQKNDKLLLCTDGLTNMVSDDEIKNTISTDDIEIGINNLIAQALQAGGIDNITAILVAN